MWGFDVWYRAAPIVVSYASRLKKVTVGCPDRDTAEALFGPGGLECVWYATSGAVGVVVRPLVEVREVLKTLGDTFETARRITTMLKN